MSTNKKWYRKISYNTVVNTAAVVGGTLFLVLLSLYFPGIDRVCRWMGIVGAVLFCILTAWFLTNETRRDNEIYNNWPK
jgi:hypothetical protein